MNKEELGNSKEISIKSTTSKISFSNRFDHFQARWGYKRNNHRVDPGLYSLGSPDPDSPVFVTSNYTLSFDALRSSLDGVDCYILVLDTKGINVWCAAGKRTFGTDELVRRIEATSLSTVVNHRKLILPQLGAPGIAAHEIKKRSGFKVEYGPVRAQDLSAYLKDHKAIPEMRRVKFPFKNRLILVPVEFVYYFKWLAAFSVVAFLLGGLLPAVAISTTILAAAILFPALLPWIPTHNFSTKGFILGGMVALSFAFFEFFGNPEAVLLQRAGWALGYLLVLPPVTAFLTLNFTGASTFTSRSGVRREMFAYIPVMAWMFGIGLVLSGTFTVIRFMGGV
jgi:CO dehydrogenase/acetyl-CoA synthase delta subunit